ncbi:MAG: 3-keto-disaccharide hydrolase [Opitutaceae bacterium]
MCVSIRSLVPICGLLAACVLASSLRASAPASDAFPGRWALTIPGGAAGWLEVKEERGWFDGSILWGGGSVLPVSSVSIADGVLTVTRVRDLERKDAAGKVVRKQQLTETLTATIEGDTLKGTRVLPRNNGSGFDRGEFTGKRIPPLPARPNLAAVKFGPPITLFNGHDLSGWQIIDRGGKSAWTVENGALVNRPPAHAPGQPRERTANLRTDREFEDFNVKLEVSVPQGSNSGVYLRGIYEVQVFDSFGKALDSHNMGALYSRITPAVAAEKPAGEWQSLEMILVDRHATVVLNGRTIIDNQPLEGCTGGALWSDQFRPGPIFLQGDHGAVSYRNIILRPVVK